MAEPAEVGEVVVTGRFVSTYHKGVGDTLTARLPSVQRLRGAQSATGPSLSGPRITLRIVGVVRSPWFSDGQQSRGLLLPTPAFLRTYRSHLVGDASWFNALVRLEGGEAALPAGLTFGVPLGVAAGRVLWRVVADYTPLDYAPPVAVTALLLVGPLALLAANLLATWPAHQAARLRTADILRAE